ncbi:MAG: putative rane protein [Clostridiales bacterium]|jgi:putative membrane protein|nr:putative rane protein [Clostridiales bacterium]
MMFGRGFYGYTDCFGPGFNYFGMWHYAGLIGLVVVAAILIFVFSRRKRNHVNDDVLMMLKEKYVRGEINEEEYTHRRDVLTRK